VNEIYKRIVFIKYTVINGILTGTYFLIYYLLIELLNINYLLSNLISYIITVLTAYYMTKIVVFKSTTSGKKGFILFVLVRIAMVYISSFGLWIFISCLDIGKYISFFIVNLATFLASYVINKNIFTRK